jgi:predicted nucleic acid-binding protein
MNEVFLDTVGLIAVWNKSDQWHASAEAAYQELVQYARRLVTTPLILWECGNAAARRPFRSYVNRLRIHFAQEGLLIEPTQQEVENGWIAYDLGEAGQAGIVDHVSFQVMRRLGIVEAFTNDMHFAAAGFKTLF